MATWTGQESYHATDHRVHSMKILSMYDGESESEKDTSHSDLLDWWERPYPPWGRQGCSDQSSSRDKGRISLNVFITGCHDKYFALKDINETGYHSLVNIHLRALIKAIPRKSSWWDSLRRMALIGPDLAIELTGKTSSGDNKLWWLQILRVYTIT